VGSGGSDRKREFYVKECLEKRLLGGGGMNRGDVYFIYFVRRFFLQKVRKEGVKGMNSVFMDHTMLLL